MCPCAGNNKQTQFIIPFKFCNWRRSVRRQTIGDVNDSLKQQWLFTCHDNYATIKVSSDIVFSFPSI